MANTILKVTTAKAVTTIQLVQLGTISKSKLLKAFFEASDQRTDGWSLIDDKEMSMSVGGKGQAKIVIRHLVNSALELVLV